MNQATIFINCKKQQLTWVGVILLFHKVSVPFLTRWMPFEYFFLVAINDVLRALIFSSISAYGSYEKLFFLGTKMSSNNNSRDYS